MQWIINKWKEYQFERKCLKHLGIKPQKMYVTQEQYDALVKRLNEPPDPEVQERIKRLLERKAPWEDTDAI